MEEAVLTCSVAPGQHLPQSAVHSLLSDIWSFSTGTYLVIVRFDRGC